MFEYRSQVTSFTLNITTSYDEHKHVFKLGEKGGNLQLLLLLLLLLLFSMINFNTKAWN